MVRLHLSPPDVDGSSIGRASDCDSDGCEFDSHPSTQIKKVMKMYYDRFNLEEEIQNVWQTKDDLTAIAERLYDDPDGPMTEDEIGNVLTGLSELHETRMKKLWKVFETMVRQKNSFLTEEVTMADALDKIVDDAGKE